MKHLISGRMAGTSGVAAFCDCGRSFFAPYQSAPDLAGMVDPAELGKAITRADELWKRHIPPDPRPRISAGELAQALAQAGVLDFDPGDARRIVIDIGPHYDEPVMVYAELYADDRWLEAAGPMRGVTVRTSPPEPG